MEVLETTKKGNAIFTIFPYKQGSTWMFDDPDRGVYKEPFVAGADTFLDTLSQGADKVGIMFSEFAFPDHDLSLGMTSGEVGSGTYYYCERLDHELWLCPCLGVYYEKSPERLFLKVIPQEEK